MVLGALIGGIVGARIMYVVLTPQEFATLADAFNIWGGGLSFHGGLIGGSVVVAGYCRYHKICLLRVVDLLSPALALGYGFARIGCFLNGCCHGGPTALPWAVTFPADGACSLPGQPLHPTQLYASALSFAIFAILAYLRPRLRQPGHVFLTYLLLYSAMRFGVEFSRAGVTGRYLVPGFWITDAQAASVGIIILAGITMVLTRPRRAQDTEDR